MTPPAATSMCSWLARRPRTVSDEQFEETFRAARAAPPRQRSLASVTWLLVFLPAFVLGPVAALYAVAWVVEPNAPEHFLRPGTDLWKAVGLGIAIIVGFVAGALAATSFWVWAMRKLKVREHLIWALMLRGRAFR